MALSILRGYGSLYLEGIISTTLPGNMVSPNQHSSFTDLFIKVSRQIRHVEIGRVLFLLLEGGEYNRSLDEDRTFWKQVLL